MFRRLIIVTLLGLTGLTGTGFIEWGNPGGDELRGGLKDLKIRLDGKLKGIKVTNKHGRSVVVHRSQSLTAPITLPAGEWAEVTLLLDGPVTLRDDRSTVLLDVESLTVVVDDPEATEIHLEWTLPTALTAFRTDDALVRALEDGGLALSDDEAP